MQIQINDMYKQQAIKIKNRRNINTKKRIDKLLELNAEQYCNLGSDSTKTEIQQAKLTSRFIFRIIKDYDNRLGDSLLRDSLQG
ncbi:MAG: hypothetical protein GOVbin2014_2 [Prokaryotic dsDNA virus sp.]|nr:MAG: hypothetical protein GOVbin2014_2 [Prokaryotic dsDNA virus sp.]